MLKSRLRVQQTQGVRLRAVVVEKRRRTKATAENAASAPAEFNRRPLPVWASAVPREDAPYSLSDVTGHLVEHGCNLALDRV